MSIAEGPLNVIIVKRLWEKNIRIDRFRCILNVLFERNLLEVRST